MNNKKVVFFSGAGISAESGIKTFREAGGLWEEYNINDVATFEGWIKNPSLVLNFYNQRRKQVMEAQPNRAHELIAELQNYFDVQVITQNIDDLHERAGSKKVLHLHGEIMKGQSTFNKDLIYPLDHWEMKLGDVCEAGSQMRPHVVWFGEDVPAIAKANEIVSSAEVFITIGSSLTVYPAANLLNVAKPHISKYLIDPGNFKLIDIPHLTVIKSTAVKGMEVLFDKLTQHETPHKS